MSEIKTPIKTLNGHALVDTEARESIAALEQKHSADLEQAMQEVTHEFDNVRGNVDQLTEEMAFKPEIFGLPIIAVTGDTTGESKDNAVALSFAYGDRTGNVERKWQGSSSLMWPKKNFTFKFDEAFEVVEGWGAQKKYCLKANYIDHSHARNVVSAKLWGQIVASRPLMGVTAVSFSADHEVESENSDVYTIDGDAIRINGNMTLNGEWYLKDFSLPNAGYTISCDVFFPEGSTSLKMVVRGYRVGSKVRTDYMYADATSAGTWETITFNNTLWADSGSTLICVTGADTSGVKIKNLQAKSGSNVYNFEPKESPLAGLPNGGAIDGFPCIITENGKFLGLYTWNIPKDGWMFGMYDSTLQQAILCADTQNEACGFKAPATLTDDFELEYVSDKDNADWVLPSINRLINACINSDGTDIDTTIAQYLDIDSAIDYLIFCSLVGGTDMYRKNYLLATFDGVKWFFSAYDMDTTYGLAWDGKSYNSSNQYPFIWDYNHKIMELLWTHKRDAVKARYTELRNTVMSEDNLYMLFTNFGSGIPATVAAEDARKWPTIPSTTTSNIAQILNWYRMRVAFMDEQMAKF